MNPEQFGNYMLQRRLGRGGMAEVFLARARSLGGFEKLLAIKRLLPPYNIDKQIISMLADEARLSVWLNHPNIVQVLDFGRVWNTYYIAMEYVDGCDLCDLIRTGQSPGRPLPLATALYVMSQVTDALDYAHRRRNRGGELLGIIHRDVSPHNVLISREGQVKLADFGLARASISVHTSHAGVIRGKFSYMPKEQARGKAIDHRIDLFAAGCTLYEALTGVKPYTSTTLPQQLYQLDQPIPPPSAHAPEIPEEIDDITMQAMSPDPDTRYASAEEMARDLRDALAKLSTLNQEAERLAGLVRSIVGAAAQVPEALPRMALEDLPIHEGSLIGDALEQVQGALPRRTDSLEVQIGPPTDENPAPLDDDDEGETFEFGSKLKRSPTVVLEKQDRGGRDSRPRASGTGTLDRQRTVALPSSGAASSPLDARGARSPLPGASPLRPHPPPPGLTPPAKLATPEGSRPRPLPPTELLDAPPRGAALPGTEEIADGLEDPTERPRERFNPRDTLDDGEAGDAAREAIDEARTIQRSPEEALAAFRRALEDREAAARERDRAKRAHRLTLRTTLILALGGVLIFGIGLITGWVLHKPPPPLPSVTIREPCEPSACPEPQCPPPKPCPKVAASLPASMPSPASRPDAAVVKAKAPAKIPVRAVPVGNKGYLTVTTNVPTTVFIDDRTTALPAPVNRLPLAPGVHRVRVYESESQSFSPTQWVTIKAGKSETLRFSLE